MGAGVKTLDGNGQHYQSQIQAYKDQLATATGVRDIADFVGQAKGLKADLEKLLSPDRH